MSASGRAVPIEAPPYVYFDANVFIYAMEADGQLGQLARRWIMRVDRGEIRGVTSQLTLAEVLPYPIAQGDQLLIDGYVGLLAHRPSMNVLAVDRSTIFEAARLRAKLGLATPDALHVATALAASCTSFLKEDDRLKTPAALTKLTLAAIE